MRYVILSLLPGLFVILRAGSDGGYPHDQKIATWVSSNHTRCRRT